MSANVQQTNELADTKNVPALVNSTLSIGAPKIPPSVQGEIITRYALGHSKHKIARELGINRRTVDRVLKYTRQDTPLCTQTASLIPKAYAIVDKALTGEGIKLNDAANIGLRVLENTEWRSDVPRTVNIDARVQQAFASLPSAVQSPDGQTTVPQLTSSTNDPSSRKATGVDMDIQDRTNFSPQQLSLPFGEGK
jgi:hypothetical protein